jgi:hypothetical protein
MWVRKKVQVQEAITKTGLRLQVPAAVGLLVSRTQPPYIYEQIPCYLLSYSYDPSRADSHVKAINQSEHRLVRIGDACIH